MNNTINSTIRNTIIAGLALVVFIPIYVNDSLFFPFITGKGFAFRIIVEIVFALWLLLILREKGSSVVNTSKSVIPRINTMTIVVTVFTVVALLADLLGYNPLKSIWSNFERMEGWLMIVHLWCYFMVLSSTMTTKDNWHRFFNVVLISGLITAFYGLGQFFKWFETHQGSRVDASLGNSAYMAVYMIINVFISAYLAISYFHKKYLFYVYTLAALFFSFIMFQTATRGSIIGWFVAIIVSCVIYGAFGRKSTGQSNVTRLATVGTILLMFLSAVLFFVYKDAKWIQNNAVLGRIATISISDTKTQARGFVWPMAVKSVFESPKSAIIGVGQENFNYVFNSHYNSKMWAHEQWFDRAHNVYLDWLVAAGLLGLISYLALYVVSLFNIVKSDRTIGQKSILVGLLVGYGIHNVFVFDNQTSYIMFIVVLAYIHLLRPGVKLPIFKNFSKTVTEDSVTVRDYIFMPIIFIIFAVSLYFINIRSIQANKILISSLQTCSRVETLDIKSFEKVFKINSPMANQEAREQLLSCATNVLKNSQTSQDKKMAFYNLAKKEIERQISETPNDTRIYIIAGSFYNSIGDFTTATPLLEKANELSPNKQSIMYELSANYINLGKNQQAIDTSEKAYLLDTENYNAKVVYVTNLINAKQSNKAIELFSGDEKIFIDPKVLNAYLYSKQYDKAIEAHKKALLATPDSQDLYVSLASAYILNSQNSMAIDTLRKTIVKFPLIKTELENLIKQLQEGKIKLPQ